MTNDGLALRLDNGLTITLEGKFTNQTNGASLGTFDNAGTVTLTGDWTNNSANTVFSTNTGLVKFMGSAAQLIGGTNTTGFFDLTEDNTFPSTALTLNKGITISNQLTLTTGHIVTTAANDLTLTATALDPTVGSNASFVKGPMKQIKNTVGSETLIYPIGKKVGAVDEMHKMELTVNHTAITSTTYEAEFFDASPVAFGWVEPASIDWVSATSYWYVTPPVGGSAVSTASVKLNYSISDGASNAAYLRIARGTASPWVNVGGVGTADHIGSITSTVPFTTFGFFTLANAHGGTNPLPIELLTFNAKPNNDKVDLLWTTASEVNNDFFSIERTVDGVNFELVGTIKGAGNTTSMLNYSTIDHQPYEGVSYYRLKQTDYDGNYSYSDLKMVDFGNSANFAFNIYPNPNNGTLFNMQLTSNKEEEILVVVYDMLGNEMYSKIIVTMDNGSAVYAIDPSQKLSAGVYMITATSSDVIYNKRLVVN
jgi:hypothetical protein